MKKFYAGAEDKEEPSIFSKKRIETREHFIREIARVFSEEFGLKNKVSGEITEIVKNLRENLPIDSRLKSSKGIFEQSCKKIAEVFNSFFGHGFIDLHSPRLCEDVSEKLYSLTVQINGEYHEVLANTNTLIKNIHTVVEALKSNFNTFKDGIKMPLARDFHDTAINTLENFAKDLKLMIGQKMDTDFLAEVKNSDVIRKYFKKFDTRYNEGLAKIFDSTYNFTSILARVNKLAEKLGLTVEQIKKIVKSKNPAQELAQTIYDRMSSVKSEELTEYLKTYDSLSKIISNKELNIAVGSREKTFMEKLHTDGEKKMEALLKIFVETLNHKFSELKILFHKLANEIADGRVKVASLADFSEDLKALHVPDTPQKYLQISGYDAALDAVAEREKFIYGLEALANAAQKLLELSKSEIFKNIIDHCRSIIALVENSVKSFSGSFHRVGSGKFADFLKNVGKSVEHKVEKVVGGTSSFDGYFARTTSLSGKDFEEAIAQLSFAIRKNQMVARMKEMTSEKINDEDFIKTVAKTIAGVKDNMSEILEKVIVGLDNSTDLELLSTTTGSPHFAKPVVVMNSGIENLTAKKGFLEAVFREQFESIWDFLEVVESLELYYKKFFDTLAEDPEKISSLLVDISVDIGTRTDTVHIATVDPAGVYDIPDTLTASGFLESRLKTIVAAEEKKNNLKVLLKVFSKIGLNGDDFKKSFKSPAEIYNCLIRFLAYGFMVKLVETGPRFELTIVENPLTNPGDSSTIFTPKISLQNLTQHVFESMLGKIVVAVDMFVILNKQFPASVGQVLSPARFVFGSGPVSLDMKLLEIYIRVPLLVQFYFEIFDREIFTKTSDSKTKSIYAELRAEGLLRNFYHICSKNTLYDSDTENIVKICNNLYDNFKSLDAIFREIILDINRKLGFDIFRKTIDNYKRFSIISDFSLYDGDENAVKQSAPSNAYTIVHKSRSFKNSKSILEINDSFATAVQKLQSTMKTVFTIIHDPTADFHKLGNKSVIGDEIKNHIMQMEKLPQGDRLSYLTDILNGEGGVGREYMKRIYKYTFQQAPLDFFSSYTSIVELMREHVPTILSKFADADWNKIYEIENLQPLDIYDDSFYNLKLGADKKLSEENLKKTLDEKLPEFSNFLEKVLSEKSKGTRIENLVGSFPENKKLIEFIFNKYGKGKSTITGGKRTAFKGMVSMTELWDDADSIFRLSYLTAQSNFDKVLSDGVRVYAAIQEKKSGTCALTTDSFNIETKGILEQIIRAIKTPVESNNVFADKGPNFSISAAVVPTGAGAIPDLKWFVVENYITCNTVNVYNELRKVLGPDGALNGLPFRGDLFVTGQPALYAASIAKVENDVNNFFKLEDYFEPLGSRRQLMNTAFGDFAKSKLPEKYAEFKKAVETAAIEAKKVTDNKELKAKLKSVIDELKKLGSVPGQTYVGEFLITSTQQKNTVETSLKELEKNLDTSDAKRIETENTAQRLVTELYADAFATEGEKIIDILATHNYGALATYGAVHVDKFTSDKYGRVEISKEDAEKIIKQSLMDNITLSDDAYTTSSHLKTYAEYVSKTKELQTSFTFDAEAASQFIDDNSSKIREIESVIAKKNAAIKKFSDILGGGYNLGQNYYRPVLDDRFGKSYHALRLKECKGNYLNHLQDISTALELLPKLLEYLFVGATNNSISHFDTKAFERELNGKTYKTVREKFPSIKADLSFVINDLIDCELLQVKDKMCDVFGDKKFYFKKDGSYRALIALSKKMNYRSTSKPNIEGLRNLIDGIESENYCFRYPEFILCCFFEDNTCEKIWNHYYGHYWDVDAAYAVAPTKANLSAALRLANGEPAEIDFVVKLGGVGGDAPNEDQINSVLTDAGFLPIRCANPAAPADTDFTNNPHNIANTRINYLLGPTSKTNTNKFFDPKSEKWPFHFAGINFSKLFCGWADAKDSDKTNLGKYPIFGSNLWKKINYTDYEIIEVVHDQLGLKNKFYKMTGATVTIFPRDDQGPDGWFNLYKFTDSRPNTNIFDGVFDNTLKLSTVDAAANTNVNTAPTHENNKVISVISYLYRLRGRLAKSYVMKTANEYFPMIDDDKFSDQSFMRFFIHNSYFYEIYGYRPVVEKYVHACDFEGLCKFFNSTNDGTKKISTDNEYIQYFVAKFCGNLVTDNDITNCVTALNTINNVPTEVGGQMVNYLTGNTAVNIFSSLAQLVRGSDEQIYINSNLWNGIRANAIFGLNPASNTGRGFGLLSILQGTLTDVDRSPTKVSAFLQARSKTIIPLMFIPHGGQVAVLNKTAANYCLFDTTHKFVHDRLLHLIYTLGSGDFSSDKLSRNAVVSQNKSSGLIALKINVSNYLKSSGSGGLGSLNSAETIKISIEQPTIANAVMTFLSEIRRNQKESTQDITLAALRKLVKYLEKIDGISSNDEWDFYEYLRLFDDKKFAKVTINENGRVRVDFSAFIEKSKKLLFDMKKKFDMNSELQSLEHVTKNVSKDLSEKCSAITGKTTETKKYFDGYRSNKLKREFSALLSSYLKTFSDKKTETLLGTLTPYRFFYGKIINPLLEESLLEEFEDPTGAINPEIYHTVRRSVVKYNDVKGTKKYIEDSYDLLPEFYKIKLSKNYELYLFKFSSFLNKLIYYKDVGEYVAKTGTDEIQKLINIVSNILSSLREIKPEIKETNVLGEISKNARKNFAASNGFEPFYPPLSFLGLLGEKNDLGLINASKAVFSGLSKEKIISFEEVLSADDKFDSNAAFNSIEYSAEMFKYFYNLPEVKIISSNIGIIFPTGVATTGVSIPVNKSRSSGIRSVLEESRKKSSISKYATIISRAYTNDPEIIGEAGRTLVPVHEKDRKNFDDFKTDKPEKLKLIYDNIISKNIMPLNLRVLYKTAALSNTMILSTIGKALSDSTNPPTWAINILNADIHKQIREVLKVYLASSSKKFKAIELLNEKNITENPRTITQYNDQLKPLNY